METTAAQQWNEGGSGPMRFDAITLFPPMFESLMQYGVTRRAHERRLWRLRAWNPRDFTQDVHRTVARCRLLPAAHQQAELDMRNAVSQANSAGS